ncbi:MAG: hypothetical protein VX733_07865 [Candidatus Latescibacterota bacterium]|nr:hypothetical protein [Candidatus Latescibacterota bacterium]
MRSRVGNLRELGVGEVLCWVRWGEPTHEQARQTLRAFSEQVPEFTAIESAL